MHTQETVAVVGIGCRFPGGAHGPRRFWDLLVSGADLTSDIPEDRCNAYRFFDPNPQKPGRMRTMHGGFLPAIDRFDYAFFGIAPREADYLDPQQRLLLETTWEAFEDAGLLAPDFAGRPVGVFVGAFTLDYKILQFGGVHLDGIGVHSATGSMMTMVSNRISYIYDFRGPSLSIDTACSSSLVATHYARASLLSGECDLALAGGVMLMAAPHYTIAESKGGFLCPDGRCKTFDESANGYARGEGVGVVLLKRLSDAVAAGNRIYAVIRGTGVNQDGHTPGITVPSGEQQIRLLERIYGDAGIAPSAVHYVEAHGTGTPVGDPIEANALGQFFSRGRNPDCPCLVGSVKTNMGHLESAAGIAGLIKASLCLRFRKIPPHLHLERPNPKIDFQALRLRVPRSPETWPSYPGVPIVGVNSFGFGGTNAHCVLQAYEPPVGRERADTAVLRPVPTSRRPFVVPLSAPSEEGLARVAARLCDWIESQGEAVEVDDLAYTLARRRVHHEYRLAAVCSSLADLADQLHAWRSGEPGETLAVARAASVSGPAKLCFVLTGNGPQWWAMGRELYRSEPVFRDAIERVARELSRYADWSLIEELSRGESDHRMGETQIAQPANFAIQYALMELYSSWGIEPDAVVGHSTGEVGAFWKAGVLTLSEAVAVVFERSRLQQLTAGKGTMAAVGLTADEAQALVAEYPGRASIAGFNAQRSITLAGDNEAMAAIVERLEAAGVFAKQVRVDCPFHSPIMDEIRDALLEALAPIDPKPVSVPLYTTATGTRAAGRELNAAHWWKNVREPVYFRQCFEMAVADGCTVFLEVGPHPVLAGAMRECADSLGVSVALLHSLHRKRPESLAIGTAAAALHCLGVGPDFARLYPSGGLVDLPLYPFAQEVCWVESAENRSLRVGRDDHPLIGRRLLSGLPVWETEINGYWNAFLLDHRIQGQCLFPGAGYLEQASAALRVLTSGSHFVLEAIELRKALFLSDDSDPRVQIALDPEAGTFAVSSLPRDEGLSAAILAAGRFRQLQSGRTQGEADLEALRARCPRVYTRAECYAELATMGFDYELSFQGIAEVRVGELESFARIEQTPGVAVDDPEWVFHPVMLDAAFQALIAVELAKPQTEGREVRLPVGIGRVRFFRGASPLMYVHARIVSRDGEETSGDILIYDAQGRLAAAVEGFRARALAQGAHAVSRQTLASWLYRVDWETQSLTPAPAEAAEREILLLLVPAGDWGVELVERFRARGIDAIAARRGRVYALDAVGRTATLDPGRKADYVRLLQDLAEAGRVPTRVVHLWGLDAPDVADLAGEQLGSRGETLAFSLLYLAQAMIECGLSARLRIVTRGAQAQPDSADAAARVQVVQAPLWGMGRVFGHQEHVGHWSGLIDLDPAADAAARPGELEALAAEILTDSGEDQVMLRGPDAVRRVMRLRRAADLRRALPVRLRGDGAYLVTGAFGALGELVADWLAARGARVLVLLGRSPLPARERWAALASDDPNCRRVRLVERLESKGVRVLTPAADLADAASVAGFFREFKSAETLPVLGLFHCAGVVKDTILMQMSESELLAAYRPKVQGAWNLHVALRDEPLEHFVLFSSIASLVTSTGQANYAAGNAFLDALAHYRRLQGLPAVSLNWGPWAVGMVRDLDLVEHYIRRGMPPIQPETGFAALEIALVQDCAQLAIAEADWTTVLQFYPRPPQSFAGLVQGEDASASEAESDPRARIAAATDAERPGIVLEELTTLVARVLRARKFDIEPSKRLSTIGLDSMLATELRNRVELTLGGTLSVVDLLSDASLAQLATKLAAELALTAQTAAGVALSDDELIAALQSDSELAAELLADLERAGA